MSGGRQNAKVSVINGQLRLQPPTQMVHTSARTPKNNGVFGPKISLLDWNFFLRPSASAVHRQQLIGWKCSGRYCCMDSTQLESWRDNAQ